MAPICFYFQMHQPLRINVLAEKIADFFNYSGDSEVNNKQVLAKVVQKCYLPATTLILDLLNRFPDFKVSYSISGVLIDQLENDFPEVIELLKKLNETGRVEFLNETYYHSLSSLYSKNEFLEQIAMHKNKISSLFGQTPETFRNTELIYSDEIGEIVKNAGYKTILAEGADRIIGWKSPNFLYSGKSNINLLLKNYKLSDDVAFRFSDWKWFDFPVTTEKYSKKLEAIGEIGDETINLFMDYETFGEHQWEVTGIFKFFEELISKLNADKVGFFNPKDVQQKLQAREVISMPDYVSWADQERDTSAWTSNEMQQKSFKAIYDLEAKVKAKNDPELLQIWRYLQTSDHFYYMSTKNYGGDSGDQDVHTYFSPYGTPQDAYATYTKALEIFVKEAGL